MGEYQYWIEQTLRQGTYAAALMHTSWGWAIAESIHFIGLTVLFGSIAAWDLRLVGLLPQVPIIAFHRLIKLAVIGFVVNASSGSFFLMTDPDQYVYNPAFHLKLLFLALAGLNVLLFYAFTYRKLEVRGPGTGTPPSARIAGATSLICWMGVIVCGRMLTFYRPWPCRPNEVIGFLARCIVR